MAETGDRKEALEAAIEYCIENHILEEFLRKYRSEVLGMLLDEFDVKKYERSLREEGCEEGLELGRAAGEVQKLIQLTYKKYQKGLTVEETAEMLEEDTETIGKIYDAIKAAGTDDIEEVMDMFSEEMPGSGGRDSHGNHRGISSHRG